MYEKAISGIFIQGIFLLYNIFITAEATPKMMPITVNSALSDHNNAIDSEANLFFQKKVKTLVQLYYFNL